MNSIEEFSGWFLQTSAPSHSRKAFVKEFTAAVREVISDEDDRPHTRTEDEEQIQAENEVARTAQEYHNALEAILEENFSGDHSDCLKSLNRICDIAKNALR